MKNIIFIFCFLMVSKIMNAQINLVPNPSFEIYDTCPNAQNQVRYAIGWYSASGSPDYYNSCYDTSLNHDFFFSVPYNMFCNYQPAADGNAYCGFYTFQSDNQNAREYMGVQLLYPMTIGKKYFVSAKFAPAKDTCEGGDCVVNKLGILFSTISHYTELDTTSKFLINNFAHLYTVSIIKDTINWTTVSGYFIADSAYQYILLGNFFDDTHTDTMNLYGPNPFGWHIAYTFVDDIMVNDTLTGISNDLPKNYFNTYPNPFKNTMTVKLNTNGKIKNGELKLINSLGTEVKKKIITSEDTIIERDNLPAGIYFLKITFDGKFFSEKIIITN